MCGIIGITGKTDVREALLEGLERLEYRGYDSAGIGLWHKEALWRTRSIGRIQALRDCIAQKAQAKDSVASNAGIGQTRWATHGNVTLENAHPHGTQNVLVVQNGIVENMEALRKRFESEGAAFESETDAELFSYALERALEQAAQTKPVLQEHLPALVANTLKDFEGSFAVLFLARGFEDTLIAFRQGHNPLAVGYKDGVCAAGSDAISLGNLVEQIAYLDDQELALLSADGITLWHKGQQKQPAYSKQHPMDNVLCRGDHPHFMHKEIWEQPKVVHALLDHYTHHIHRLDLPKVPFKWSDLSLLRLTACGTASYAAMLGATFFEMWAHLPTLMDVASEFPLKVPSFPKGGAVGFISQSGETADTLAALGHAKKHHQHTFSLLNTTDSAMGRLSDTIFPLCAGPEMSVASTKAFMAQLLVLMFTALEAAKARKTLSDKQRGDIIDALEQLPDALAQTLALSHMFQQKAQTLVGAKSMLYLGRGPFFAMALEGALKMKEITYIHAEGYAAGEIKHGPMALVEEGLPVLILAPSGPFFLKTLANIQEVMARGANALILTDETGFTALNTLQKKHALVLPDVPEVLSVFTQTVALQLLAYDVAAALGHDVDRPRNLAKSVTVV